MVGTGVGLSELLPADAQLFLLSGKGGKGKTRPRRLRRVGALVGSTLRDEDAALSKQPIHLNPRGRGCSSLLRPAAWELGLYSLSLTRAVELDLLLWHALAFELNLFLGLTLPLRAKPDLWLAFIGHVQRVPRHRMTRASCPAGAESRMGRRLYRRSGHRGDLRDASHVGSVAPQVWKPPHDAAGVVEHHYGGE